MVLQFINQIRVLFPRWNFFDQLGHRFQLKYKTSENKNWNLVSFSSERKLLNFFCNADHNLTLAQISAIELFAQDLQKHDHELIPNLESFKIIKSLVDVTSEAEKFQFRIEAYTDQESVVLYTSTWLQKGFP